MERRHMPTPLLIGGATTSRQHTAVKIAPEFSGATVHVLDASRAVDVVSSLLSDRQRDGVHRDRAARAGGAARARTRAPREKPLLTLADARANHLQTDWDTLEIPMPWFVGRRVVEPALEELIPFIDWTFFFSAWELKGRFPAILDHPDYGGPARELYDNAQAVLARIIAREAPHGARRLRLLARQHRRRRHRRVQGRRPTGGGRAVPHAAAAGADRRRPAESIARRLHRAARVARARLHRRVCRDGGHRRRRPRARVREAPTTTTTRSSPRRWPTGSPRRSPSTCTRRRARTGATATDEALSTDDLHRREVPRHPAGVRLSRVPGPQREDDAVPVCSTRRRSASRSPSRSR